MTIKEIQKIIKEFETSSLMTLELEMDDFKLRLSKNKETNVVATNRQLQDSVELEKQPIPINYKKIKSPLVGTFFASSDPDGEPYVKVGQQVKKGQIVCIIEAMKILNEITSPFNGIVKEVLVKNLEVVGFDQHLISITEENEK